MPGDGRRGMFRATPMGSVIGGSQVHFSAWFRGSHLSNTSYLTHAFFKRGKQFGKLWWSLMRRTTAGRSWACLDRVCCALCALRLQLRQDAGGSRRTPPKRFRAFDARDQRSAPARTWPRHVYVCVYIYIYIYIYIFTYYKYLHVYVYVCMCIYIYIYYIYIYIYIYK